MLQTMPLSAISRWNCSLVYCGCLDPSGAATRPACRGARPPSAARQRPSWAVMPAFIDQPITGARTDRSQLPRKASLRRPAIGEVGDPLLVSAARPRTVGPECSTVRFAIWRSPSSFGQTPPERPSPLSSPHAPWTTFFNGDCASNKLTAATLPAA